MLGSSWRECARSASCRQPRTGQSGMTIAGAPEDAETGESRKGYGKAYDGTGALVRGLTGGGVAGAGGAAVVAGAVLARTPLILLGVGLLALDLLVLRTLAK